MEKITFKNGQAPYINDTNLNQMQNNIEKEFEIERINITLSDDVESGQICCLRCGKVVIVEVSDLKLKTDKSEWETIIAYGLPKQSNKYNTWIKSILYEGKGVIYTGDNVLTVSERTGKQIASSIYIGQLIYLTD